MASTSAVSMVMPVTYASQKRVVPSSDAFFKPLTLRSSKVVAASNSNGRFQVRTSMKEKVVTGLTAAALTASMMVPDVAEAAVSPSLKNFLLSIAAGGVVVVAIIGAVIELDARDLNRLEFPEIVGLPAARAVRSDGEEFSRERHGGAVVHLFVRGESLDGASFAIYDGGANAAPASENGVVLFVRGNEV
ncbi:hypothetical protein GmHk_09G024956 [Glycine max]|nr:hypothetical protein GmHk_09G024956 [Glycine max]